jgi:GT2 family glycosyltransferase
VEDNVSADDSLELLSVGLPRTTLMRSSHNVGFARANNLGARQSSFGLGLADP